jgi:hypothetical protein
MSVIQPTKKQIQINGNLYEYQLINARKAGKISSKFISKAVATGAVFVGTKEVDNLYFCIQNFIDDEAMENLYELIFSVEAQLKCNGAKIIDPDNFFMGKYMEMMQLCYDALRGNCEDFFTFIVGFLKKNLGSLKNISELTEGVALPPEIQSLLQTILNPKAE